MTAATTVALAVLTAAVIVLAVIVTGLLRSHATILRRLHELGAGAGDDPAAAAADAAAPPRTGTSPPGGEQGREAADVSGVDPDGGALALRTVGVDHDTVLAFLSSGCDTCRAFWDELSEPGLPAGTRAVVVTRGRDEESPAAVAGLAPASVPVVMSGAAWEDYDVPGAPYVVHVAGPDGRVRGEGTAGSWQRARRMLVQAADDRAREGGADHPGGDRHGDADRALLAAGIRPGDPSLYPDEDGPGDEPAGADRRDPS